MAVVNAILSPIIWIMVLLLFGGIMAGIGFLVWKKNLLTRDWFLAADRKMGWNLGAWSIAATWIWAPALFVAAQISFQSGYVKFLWFLIPNVLTLLVFGIFAQKLRNKVPEGYTFGEYVLNRFGVKSHNLYMLQILGLTVSCFAVQLLAGSGVLSMLTGINFTVITILLAILVLAYSYLSALETSYITDWLQMILIFGFGLILIPWAISSAGGVGMLDWTGVKNVTGFFSNAGIEIMVTFGIINAIGLMAGPFGDQMFWQRAFSIKKNEVKKAFIVGGLIFGLVPLMMSMLGFLGAGMGLVLPGDASQYVNVVVIQKLLPAWCMIPFVVILLSGLTSTMDSALCSISSIGSIDIFKRFRGVLPGDDRCVRVSRAAMILLTVGGILIANIPGLTIITLWLFYGTFRAATLLPTAISIVTDKIHPNGVVYGLLFSFLVGIPIYAYGSFFKVFPYDLYGAIITVLSSGVIMVVYSRWKLRGEDRDGLLHPSD